MTDRSDTLASLTPLTESVSLESGARAGAGVETWKKGARSWRSSLAIRLHGHGQRGCYQIGGLMEVLQTPLLLQIS